MDRPAPATDAPPPVARLFVALWPDHRVRQALARWQDRWAWPPRAARVPARELHLTLHFLGAVARERLPLLLRELCVPCAPFELEFGTAEVWHHGTAVLCASDVPPGLAGLHRSLAERLPRLGLPVEQRAFRPHVTLARRAVGARPPAAAMRLQWPVRDYALVESRGGYHVLQRYRDGAGEA